MLATLSILHKASSDATDKWSHKQQALNTIQNWFNVLKTIPMYAVLIPLTVYVFKNKRTQRFELSILALCFLKYATYLAQQASDIISSEDPPQPILQSFASIYNLSAALIHWIYASQYLITYFLTKDVVKKALLICNRHQQTIEDSYGRRTSVKDIVEQNNALRTEVKSQKTKRTKIKKTFLWIDIFFALILVAAQAAANFIIAFNGEDPKKDPVGTQKKILVILVINMVSLLISALLLTSSVACLACSIKRYTGRKHNSCLIYWHNINFLVLITFFVLSLVFCKHILDALENQDRESEKKNSYYASLTFFVYSIFELYVDIFLIWLLYRFVQPQRTIGRSTTEASVLLFAHDPKMAQQTLVNIYREDRDSRRIELTKRADTEFAEFLIKDWLSELVTEQQISLEFLDRSERDSIQSSSLTGSGVISDDSVDQDLMLNVSKFSQ